MCAPIFAGTLAETLPGTNLAALEAIQKSGLFQLQVFTRTVGGRQEAIVLLGETHIKSGAASRLGKDFLNGFYGDVGVEGVDWDSLFLGRALRGVIYSMHETVGTVFFGADRQPSTILDALTLSNPPHDPHRVVLRLEQGHEPDWMESASLWVLSAVVARTLAEGGVRLSMLAVRTGKGLIWAVSHPREIEWKKLFSSPPSPPADVQAQAFLNWLKAVPARMAKAVIHAPGKCGEAVLQFLALSPNDPTRSFPLWKRLAVKADEGLRYTFLGLIGGNVYLYYHPGIPLGLLNGRNDDMVRNALAHLRAGVPPPDSDDDAPETRPFLVVEGMGHLPGWGHLLEREGFKRAY